jgi:hypothetical protein
MLSMVRSLFVVLRRPPSDATQTSLTGKERRAHAKSNGYDPGA